MLLSFSHLPPAQARADECSSLPSSTRGNEAKPDVEKQSAGRPYSVTRRGAWHVFIRRCRFSRGYLSACSDASSHLRKFVFSVSRLSPFNNSSMPAPTTRRSPPPDSILRVPSSTFNICHPSVVPGDVMNFTEVFCHHGQKFHTFCFF